MDRTLCPMDKTKKLNMTSQQSIFVTVATMSNTVVNFNLMANILPDFELESGKGREMTVSPSQPQYYMYTFPKDVDTVLLRVTSNDPLCAVISVQPIKCPVLDLDEDIGSVGKHQTMTTKAAFFLEALYVIVLVKPKLTDCSAPDDTPPQERLNVTTKNLSILITNTMSKSNRLNEKSQNWDFHIIQILIAVALFYGIPAAQLVFSYQKIGALEFSAFNNILSNIGYLILGLLFIAIVKMRSWRYEAYMQENRQWIPKQYGLMYAMGVALMVVGIMSAIYHFCPTKYNYQFG
ncbi:hypothetical protein C0Q70_12463 [Pomacea canaliculata]|uniref:Uncharacterized protein n=1 Tax=Pomacea canaliculata TaxID=400727 RepID=A0A2T7P1K7_POMCA|nr:hypothetical protein C0Q70_12463 [Pomacea canaliculata]